MRSQPFPANPWLQSLVAGALLGGACVAPEFDKVEALDGTGGASGIGAATTNTAGGSASTTPASVGTSGPEQGGTTASGTETTTTAGGVGGTQAACSEGLSDCDGECVDTLTAFDHCGACGIACTAVEQCTGGTCECVPGYTPCYEECVQLSSDNRHCGGCGSACDSGDVCSNSVCSADCGQGLTECGSRCVDTNTNPEHCGGCAQPCATGFECSEGTCVCSGGLTVCSGACVDTQVSELNCGACGTSCGVGQLCVGGSCDCSMGTVPCDGACVNTDSNIYHCGACGVACGENESCNSGTCGCSERFDSCSGNCVSLRDDRLHCGSCNNACEGVCRDGECGFVAGYWKQGYLKGCAFSDVDELGSTRTPVDFTSPYDPLYCIHGTLADSDDAFVMVGVNTNQPAETATCSSGYEVFNKVSFDIAGLGNGIAARLKVNTEADLSVQLDGENGAVSWCADMPPPDASDRAYVPFSAFTTECRGTGSGVNYAGGLISTIWFVLTGASEPYELCFYDLAPGNSAADAP